MEPLFRSFETMIAELDTEIADLQRQINEATALRNSTRTVLAGWKARYSRQLGTPESAPNQPTVAGGPPAAAPPPEVTLEEAILEDSNAAEAPTEALANGVQAPASETAGEQSSPPGEGDYNQPPPKWQGTQAGLQRDREQTPTGEQPWTESNPSAWPSQS